MNSQSASLFPQFWFMTCSSLVGRPIAISVSNLLFLCGLSSAGVAQLVEHLICNQRVGGSIPSASSTIFWRGSEADRIPVGEHKRAGVSGHESVFCFHAHRSKHSTFWQIPTRNLCRQNFADGWVSG